MVSGKTSCQADREKIVLIVGNTAGSGGWTTGSRCGSPSPRPCTTRW